MGFGWVVREGISCKSSHPAHPDSDKGDWLASSMWHISFTMPPVHGSKCTLSPFICAHLRPSADLISSCETQRNTAY